MRLSSELYKGILEELDKYNSPSFPLSSFYYYYNKSRLEWLNDRYALFEKTQEITDDLQVLIRGTSSNNSTINLTTLNLINQAPAITVDFSNIINSSPFTNALASITTYNITSNYYHLLLGSIIYTFTASYMYKGVCYKVGDTLELPIKRLTDDKKGFILKNSYFSPKWYRPYFKIENNIVYLVNGNTNDLPPATFLFKMNYLKHPKLMILGTDSSGTIYTGWDIVSEFTDYVDNEQVNKCVQLFLENIEQKRLGTNIPINQPAN